MTTYGLTPQGFSPKPLDAILSDLVTAQQATIAPDLDTSAESVVGQMNAIVAPAIASLWQLAASVYSARTRQGASFAALDDVGALTGTPREPATYGTVLLTCTLGYHKTIPRGSIAGIPGNSASAWITNEDVTQNSFSAPTVTVEATCATIGKIPANANTITQILTPVSGWTGVNNPADAVAGVDAESDPAYRIRQAAELDEQGATTVPALTASILAKLTNPDASQSVQTCIVEENATDFLDALGRPPHCIEAVVQWTANTLAIVPPAVPVAYVTLARQALAELIWQNGKPAGIDTYSGGGGAAGGALHFLEVLDSRGVEHGIYWTEPTYVALFVSVSLTYTPGVYVGDAAVQLALANALLGFDMGETVYLSQLESIVIAPTISIVGGVTTVTPSGVVNVVSIGMVIGSLMGAVRAAAQGNLAGTRVADVVIANSNITLTKAIIDSGWSTGAALATNDRILLPAQTSGIDNGIYTVTSLGSTGVSPWVLTRATDADLASGVPQGMIVPVSEGTDANTYYQLSTAPPVAVDVSPLSFTHTATLPVASSPVAISARAVATLSTTNIVVASSPA